ncbi:MAG TPA: hypothetical protein ENG82_00775, partial [Bacteroidetes bacterium]|nr:hypothetical protein [Bacteroidota bacterium]
MTKNFKFIFVIFFAFFNVIVTRPLPAQTVRSLTLEEAIAIARKKSVRMQTLYENLRSAKENLTAAKGQFRTNAHLNLSTP